MTRRRSSPLRTGPRRTGPRVRGGRGGRGRAAGRLRRGLLALLLLGLAATLAAVLAPTATLRPLKRWWAEHQGLLRVEGHSEILLAAARESRVDPYLLAGVMMVESRGHVDARSAAGALGLFQLMPPTAGEQAALLGLSAPSERELCSDGRLNARLGARYLAWLLGRFQGDVERALVAYNAGPGRLKRWTEQAGSYAAWRDARERAGDSEVLAYARDVQRYRDRFAERGVIAPTAALDPPRSESSDAPPGPRRSVAPEPPDPGGPSPGVPGDPVGPPVQEPVHQ